MNSGLYAWAGASATASAAACANRFDEPMTNESKLYFSFRPSTRGFADLEVRLGARAVALDVADREVDAALVPGRVADGGVDEAEEMALDPLPREVVRDRE